MLGAWKDPLNHVVTELSGMEEAPTAIIERAKIVKIVVKGLQEGVRRILRKVCSLLMFLCFSCAFAR